MSGAVREWTEGGNPPPLLMTIQEWRTSADVFPIEYADIRDSHIRLSGADPFDGIRIGAEHLRLQLEHELRSRKIQLREGLLVAGDEPEAVAALLTASLATFLTFFRAALRLAGRTVPRESAALIQAASELAGFDPSSVLAVERARRDSSQRSDLVQPPVLSGYLAAIESTVAWLDGHAVPNGVEVR